jgi:hypothetical protein
MAAEAVGAKLNLKLLNLMTGEHMKPEFLQVCMKHLNPQLHPFIPTPYVSCTIAALNR